MMIGYKQMENSILNTQYFWNDDLHLPKTGYQKFATSLFSFIYHLLMLMDI